MFRWFQHRSTRDERRRKRTAQEAAAKWRISRHQTETNARPSRRAFSFVPTPCSSGSHARASGIYRLAAITSETMSLRISQKEQELQAPHDAMCSLEAERTLAA
jgi:hypothetical protein